MIYGIGCDIVDIHRFEKYVDDKKRLEKLYTENELNEFYKITNKRRKMEFLAGRFAAKEAYAKALGTGIGQHISFQDIEVLNDATGKPILVCERYSHQTWISITHTSHDAYAVVVLESNKKKE